MSTRDQALEQLEPDVDAYVDQELEPSELDIETQIEGDKEISPIGRLARQLSDGDLLEVADFHDDGTARNFAARELYRRWQDRARKGWPILDALPAIAGGRLVFQQQQPQTVRRQA